VDGEEAVVGKVRDDDAHHTDGQAHERRELGDGDEVRGRVAEDLALLGRESTPVDGSGRRFDERLER